MKNLLCIILVLFTVACGGQAAGTPHGEEEIPASALTGTVVETFASAGYTYLRLDTPNGEVWAAIQETPMETGRQVAIVNAMLMEDFESPSLGRTFERIVFGSLFEGSAGAPDTPAAMAPPAGMGMGSSTAPTTGEAIMVEKADGGLSIAEIFAQKASLAGQQVVVRGQVVKYNSNIMGKNWLHIQDGSGDAANADHDITITTMDTAAVGDVVVIRGTVVVDKDFGAGYSYDLMLEEATVEQ